MAWGLHFIVRACGGRGGGGGGGGEREQFVREGVVDPGWIQVEPSKLDLEQLSHHYLTLLLFLFSE